MPTFVEVVNHTNGIVTSQVGLATGDGRALGIARKLLARAEPHQFVRIYHQHKPVPNARLDWDKVHTIRMRLANDELLEVLAAEYNTTRQYLIEIKSGRAWPEQIIHRNEL